jgi:hypothetical protein
VRFPKKADTAPVQGSSAPLNTAFTPVTKSRCYNQLQELTPRRDMATCPIAFAP